MRPNDQKRSSLSFWCFRGAWALIWDQQEPFPRRRMKFHMREYGFYTDAAGAHPKWHQMPPKTTKRSRFAFWVHGSTRGGYPATTGMCGISFRDIPKPYEIHANI